jgi:hypothetical protein
MAAGSRAAEFGRIPLVDHMARSPTTKFCWLA